MIQNHCVVCIVFSKWWNLKESFSVVEENTITTTLNTITTTTTAATATATATATDRRNSWM